MRGLLQETAATCMIHVPPRDPQRLRARLAQIRLYITVTVLANHMPNLCVHKHHVHNTNIKYCTDSDSSGKLIIDES